MKKHFSLLLFVLAAFSCADNKNVSEFVTVDMAHAVDGGTISTSGADSLVICNSDEYQIGMINKVVRHEGGYLVSTKGMLLTVNNDGEITGHIGNRGRSESEYLGISDFWIDGSSVMIYDFNGMKILSYGIDGTFISSEKIAGKGEGFLIPGSLVPFADGYVGKCTYVGTMAESPALAYYPEDLSSSAVLGTLTVKSGLRVGYPLVISDDASSDYGRSILYWNSLGREIYRISGSNSADGSGADGSGITVDKSYEIDFGGRNFPSLDETDEYDLIEKYNNDDVWRSNHSGMIIYMHENPEYLYFTYMDGGNTALGVYDRKSGKACSYALESNNGEFLSCVFYGKSLLLFEERDDHTVVFSLPLPEPEAK